MEPFNEPGAQATANSGPRLPGPRHWGILSDSCRRVQTSGKLVQDAWSAAPAIESGCKWVTTDRGYARFRGLRGRAPF